MSTRHIFNSMKLLYNHIADQYDLEEVWFEHPYTNVFERAESEPREVVRTIVIFLYEIKRRQNLDNRYFDPMVRILNNLRRASGCHGVKEIKELTFTKREVGL